MLATPVPVLEAMLPAVWQRRRAARGDHRRGQHQGAHRGARRAAGRPRPLRFVGSHPMAGSEHTGYGVARADLFQGATVVVTPTARTDAAALDRVGEFWQAPGARLVRLDPASHDRAVAAISHLPHLVAGALVDAVIRMDPASSTSPRAGFKDTTRIAAATPPSGERSSWPTARPWASPRRLPPGAGRSRGLLAAGDAAALERIWPASSARESGCGEAARPPGGGHSGMRAGGRREPVITIDGPAGAGKSTAARALAARLGYQAAPHGRDVPRAGVGGARAGLPPRRARRLAGALDRAQVELGRRARLRRRPRRDRRHPRARDRRAHLGSPRSGSVREKMTPLQRALAAAGGVVLEGRDTGTVVCPDAEVKFYLDAVARGAGAPAPGRAGRARRRAGPGRGPAELARARPPGRRAARWRRPERAGAIDRSTRRIARPVAERSWSGSSTARGAGAVLYAVLKPLAVALMRLSSAWRRGARSTSPRRARCCSWRTTRACSTRRSSAARARGRSASWPRRSCSRSRCSAGSSDELNARPVRREGADSSALRTALRVLAGGRALLVFPEGTRGDGGQLGRGKAGAGMLAVLSGAAVVPVYVRGTGRALPRGRSCRGPRR